MIIILAIIALIVWFVVLRKFKYPKCGNMCAITGGVKSGKSTFSLALAYRTYKRNLRAVKFDNWVRKHITRKSLNELPLFYSTIPVGFPHVRLDKELLLRKTRFAYKSVIWIDEASLIADSQSYGDMDVNTQLLLFTKLIAHETRGGACFINTQSCSDMHYSFKRVLSNVFYVHATYKWIPFFLVCTVREERYAEDGTAISTYGEDLEKSLCRVLIPKSIWKKFDCYCYSVLTDSNKVNDKVEKADTLKARKIVSFNPRHEVDMDKKNIKEIFNEKKKYRKDI